MLRISLRRFAQDDSSLGRVLHLRPGEMGSGPSVFGPRRECDSNTDDTEVVPPSSGFTRSQSAGHALVHGQRCMIARGAPGSVGHDDRENGAVVVECGRERGVGGFRCAERTARIFFDRRCYLTSLRRSPRCRRGRPAAIMSVFGVSANKRSNGWVGEPAAE